MIMVIVLPFSSAMAFTDTDQSHPNIDAIYWMNAYQYMVGYDNDTFRPERAINRAEFLKVILTMTNNDVNLSDEVTYQDVKKGEWFFTFVANATDLGYISGYPDGLFRPNAKIRVSEAAKIISLSFDLPVGPKVRGDRWYTPYVRYMTENNLLPVDVVDPRNVMTRAQAAEVLYRVANFIEFEPAVGGGSTGSGSGDGGTTGNTGGSSSSGSGGGSSTGDSGDGGTTDSGATTGGGTQAADCEAASGHNCYYIAPNGTGNGSMASPAGKFGDIASQVMPGDYVYFRGGTYGESNMTTFTSAIDHTFIEGVRNTTGCERIDGACRFDVKSFIPLTDFNGYASDEPTFNVASGTSNNKITVKAYRDENPVLDASAYFRDRTLEWPYMNAAVYVDESNWVVEGFDIVGGLVYIGGEDTRNVDIVGNRIHDLTILGGENPGLVTIDRGWTYGGPSNIRVLNNELFNFYDTNSPGQIPGNDVEHHGAITMLSAQAYVGFAAGGTGRVEIKGNEFYNVPQAFYMKNPATGPLVIENNHFRDLYTLGVMNASNVSFHNNLVEDIEQGFWRVSGANQSSSQMIGIDGQNVSITNNTFVNFDYLAGISAYTNGFVSRNNVFFGMTGYHDEYSNWSTPSYIYVREDLADAYPGTSGSVLHTVTSDNNCFISPYSNFNFTQRRFNSPNTTLNLGRIESADVYGLDVNSEFRVSTNLSDIFQNPAAGNYSLRSGVCTGKGKLN